MRKAAEERAAAKRKANAEAQRESSRIAFQNWEETINRGTDSVDAHWEQLWQQTLYDASVGNADIQTVFLTLRDLEHKLIDDEMIFQGATIPKEISDKYRNKMSTIQKGFATWARMRRQACESFRLAIGRGDISDATLQATTELINKADSFMLRSNLELISLEEEINN